MDEGNIINGQNNVKYVYDGSAWQPADPAKKVYAYAGASYIASYPYSSDNNGLTTEAAIITAFTPNTDQSTQAGYTASDLMTGAGTVTGTTLEVTLAHKMALLEISLPSRMFGATPKPASGAIFTIGNNGSAKPCFANDVYRYIVKPSGSLTVSGAYAVYECNTPISYTEEVSLAAGKYTRLDISDAISSTPVPTYAVGDYYPDPANSGTAEGVVYEVNDEGTHGKMVHIKQSLGKWGRGIAEDTGNNGWYIGLANTRNVIDSHKDESDFASVFEVFYYVYHTLNNGYVNGKWYIPNENELKALFNAYRNFGETSFNTKLTDAGGEAFSGAYQTSYTFYNYDSQKYHIVMVNCSNSGASQTTQTVSGNFRVTADF